MGCGFSTQDKASDEEQILNQAAVNASADKMGAGLPKHAKKSTSASANKRDNNLTNRINKSSANHGKIHNGRKTTTSPLNIQSSATEVSSSQVNFFKMLDEKIENGVEPEEQDSEHERLQRLQRVAEEWDNLLGKSQDSSNDLPNKEPSDNPRDPQTSSVTLPPAGRPLSSTNNNKSAPLVDEDPVR